MQSLRKKSVNPTRKEKTAIIFSLLIVIVVALVITSIGFIDNNLRFESDYLTISGPHGTAIALHQIDSIYLTEKRPEAIRVRGYQMGYRKKGRFRNKQGEEFLMLINSRALPWIVIQKKDGHKIFYSHSRISNKDIFSELKEKLPR
jgi:hypothetical protein